MLYRMEFTDYKKPVGIIVMLVVASVILYLICSSIYGNYVTAISNEPWLVEGTKMADSLLVIPNSQIPQSVDGKYGVEFSYSFWMVVNRWSNSVDGNAYYNSMMNILIKGDPYGFPSACPSIWLLKSTNSMLIKMNTFAPPLGDDELAKMRDSTCDSTGHVIPDCPYDSCGKWTECTKIDNIPVNKWVFVVVSVINKNLDIYIDGFIKKRAVLRGIPKQNNGNLYVNAFNGFNGLMSRVRYFNYALPQWKIDQTMKQGPSDMRCGDDKAMPPYLADDYWFKNK